MPELPEVETVRRGLDTYLRGHRILKYEVLRHKSFPNDETLAREFLVGATVIRVRRRAKLLLVELSTNYTLVVHLKMTGQLVYRAKNGQKFGAGHPNNSLVASLPDKTTRVIITLDDAMLFFNDQRVFGWMKLVASPEVEQLEFIKKLGPEPLTKTFTDAVFIERVRRRKKSRIKSVILDQTVLAGVGNIYADEALWYAKIHPESRVEDIGDNELKALRKAIIKVLKLGLSSGGSTDRNYVDAQGRKGSYLLFAKVFRRENQACERCGDEIRKIKVVGRGTHVCNSCQKPPKTA